LLLIASGWAQAPGEIPQAAPLRNPFANPLRAVVKPVAPGSKAGEQKPAAAPAQPSPTSAATPSAAQPVTSPVEVKAVSGRRDPFISPVTTAAANAACITGGKRCLAVDRIKLKGLVRSESGYIAVVVNAANRAYFLRENDPLMNGYVMRITSTAVTLKENGKDRIGKPTTREVTLTLGTPVGLPGG
jgi:Tfp pilus assembly protein PilP